MLQAIRDKVTGWIAYGIIFLISIPFALWGVNSYLGGGEALPAATVNGEEITARDLDQAYANYRQRLSRLFGGSIPESFGSEEILRQQVLGQLIETYALRQYAREQRYRISDTELNRLIRGMEVFQNDGRFDTAIYESQLRSLGYSPLGFEQELRTDGAMEQVQTGIVATSFVVPVRQKLFTSLNSQTRKIRSLSYSIDVSGIEVEPAEIELYYQSNASNYRTMEQVKVDYIELNLENVKQGIAVGEDDLLARYQDNLDSYTTPEQREASHILIQVNKDSPEDQARAKIGDIRQRIVNGESFADLARELSEDPGSAGDGGNLGEIERGVMVQAFEAALFAMQVDQLSEPVKSAFGWHLIKLHSISGGETRSFESVRTELEDEIRTELAEGQVFDLAENLANLAYEQSDSLLPAAEQLDLELQTSDWFDALSGQGIAAESKVRQAAFSPEVKQQGLNSEAIELGSDRILFVRINEVKPAAQRDLEEVEQSIRQKLITDKLREQNSTQGQAALADLKSGKTLDQLAQEWSGEITDHGFIERNQPAVDQSIRRRAFTMPKPEQGLVYDGLSLNDGKFLIIELSAILSNDAISEPEKINELISAQGSSEYQSALKLLTRRADVVRTPLEDLQALY